jgi:energy-coupling factor transporter ATP-binding protein EcfA2
MPISNSDKGSLFDSVEIIGLFGDQNEFISFEEHENLKILYGLNASGKSTILSIINAVLNKDYISLMRLPFEKVIFKSKRYSRRKNSLVPIYVEFDTDEYKIIGDLAGRAELLWMVSEELTENDDSEEGVKEIIDEIYKLDIPCERFIDSHILTVSKIKPAKMLVRRDDLELEHNPGILLRSRHEFERNIFSEDTNLLNLIKAIRDLDSQSNLNEIKSPWFSKNYDYEFFNSFGGTSDVIDIIRTLDKLDISTKKWRDLKIKMGAEYVIEITDSATPERYQFQNDIEDAGIYIRDYDEDGDSIPSKDFINDYLPKKYYKEILLEVMESTNIPPFHRIYLDEEGLLIKEFRPIPFDSPCGIHYSRMHSSPINYFLQNDMFRANEIPHQEKNRARFTGLLLYDKIYPSPNIINLSAARTVGDNYNEKSELVDFSNSMRSKINDAVIFLQGQAGRLILLWNEIHPDSPGAFMDSLTAQNLSIKNKICLSDSKSNSQEELSIIIEETETYLDLIQSSLKMFTGEIVELITNECAMSILSLSIINDATSDNIIHLHDKDISLEKIWVAIEDLTSIFRLKRMLEDHFGKQITLIRGRFYFSDINSNNLRINELSSGEKQLMLLYWKILDGMKRDGLENIVLIDEPELSLHISWQRDFVENLLELLVKQSRYGDEADGRYDVKIIIATHSPSILTNHFDLSYELGLSDGV